MASGVAAAGAAVAFYFYSRKLKVCGFGGPSQERHDPVDQHFEGAYQAPSTWIEALYFFAEALRYMYHESLGRWRSSDLLIGLAYLAQHESATHAALDIAGAGTLVGHGEPLADRLELAKKFRRIAHFMKFCQALRERHMPTQRIVLSKLGIAGEDVLLQQGFAGMLKPSFVMVKDHKARCIVLAIRGTHSIKDMFTSLTSATKPHHVVVDSQVVLGYSHFGMLAAARWVLQQTETKLLEALESEPSYQLQIVGHSLGGGTAALLTARLREMGGRFAEATCLAIACPACMTKELATSCAAFTTTIINGHDMIPTLSPGAADALREEVMQSSWYEAFMKDLRSSVVVRAVEASLGSVGSMTSVASSWTSARFSSASERLRSCYTTGPSQHLTSASTGSSQNASRGSEVGEIEDAKAWIPSEGATPNMIWDEVLDTVEPIDRFASSPGTTEAGFSGRKGVDVRASWPPSAPAHAPPAVSRPGLWTRLWPNCGSAGQPGPALSKLKIDEAEQDSNFDSLQPPDTPSMAMARTLSEDLAIHNAMETSVSPSDLTNGLGNWGSPSERLLSDLEPDESKEAGNTHLSKQTRRTTFPAGSIYHMLPARLVFGESKAVMRKSRRLKPRPALAPFVADHDELQMSDEAADTTLDTTSEADPFQNVFREGVDGDFVVTPGEDPYLVITTSRAQGKIGVAPPIPPLEDLVLLQEIPQEVYGKIRLCKRMLADHFIPVYLGSLEIALDYLENDYFDNKPD